MGGVARCMPLVLVFTCAIHCQQLGFLIPKVGKHRQRMAPSESAEQFPQAEVLVVSWWWQDSSGNRSHLEPVGTTPGSRQWCAATYAPSARLHDRRRSPGRVAGVICGGVDVV